MLIIDEFNTNSNYKLEVFFNFLSVQQQSTG